MKRASGKGVDEMRSEYKRSDFGTLVRGKYAQRLRESSNVVVIAPDLAKAFPNARAANTALRRLLRERNALASNAMKKIKKSEEPTERDAMNIVLLDPDVHAGFPNAAAVDKGLRASLDAVPARRPKRQRR
jgi:hypothetical protein